MKELDLDEIIELDDSKLQKIIEEVERMKLGKRQMTRRQYYEITGGVGIKEEEAEKILQESKDDMFTTSSFNVDDETLINILQIGIRDLHKGEKRSVTTGLYTENLAHNLLAEYNIKTPLDFIKKRFITKKFIYFFEQVFVKKEPYSGAGSKYYRLCRERKRK